MAHASVPTKYWTTSFRTAVFPSITSHLQLLNVSLLMSMYLALHPALISYGSLDVLATLYCHLLVDPSWNTNQSVVFLLDTQPTTRDTTVLNRTLVIFLSTDISNSMSCTFLSRLIQFQIQLILDYFSYKLFLSLLKIMLCLDYKSVR
jgi:hypothetical protein